MADEPEKKNPLLPKGDKETIQVARELRVTMQTEGWRLYEKLLRIHLEQEYLKVMAPAEGMDDLVKQNASKGAFLGIKLCADLPHGIIRAADAIVARRSPQEDLDE